MPGLPDGIPIAGIAGDQQAALFGQACFAPGEAKCTYGTGAFLLMNTGDDAGRRRSAGLLTTVAWKLGDASELRYALEGSAFIAGAAVQWLRDGLGIITTAARGRGAGAHGARLGRRRSFVPALAGLGAPHWRPDARGAHRRASPAAPPRAPRARGARGHRAPERRPPRARWRPTPGRPLTRARRRRRAANDLLMQFQADLLGVAIARPEIVETTALGAAFLAGLGAGVWTDQDAASAGPGASSAGSRRRGPREGRRAPRALGRRRRKA